jgi:hypothetical protein
MALTNYVFRTFFKITDLSIAPPRKSHMR